MIDRVKLGKDYARLLRRKQRTEYKAWITSCAYRSVEDELAEVFLKKGVRVLAKTTIPDTLYVVIDGETVYLVTGKSRSQLLRLSRKITLQEYYELEEM